ncbi:MAG: tyrosine-type recombinase/integrase [Romboutsia sp.]|uniref:tyrosine-type recombinase/integrase n=1 Tax=Romboutsia sp. TaxID=1965302 RepID=UPI003F401458
MGRNLKYQFKNAIDRSFKLGMEKHSLKKTEGLGNGRIFSYADRTNLIDFSANLANYLRENNPEIKLIKEIRSEHIQGFFNSKKGCTKATLEQYKSKLNKLEILVNQEYSIKANLTRGYQVPKTHRKENVDKLRDVSMPKSEYNKLINSIANSNSTAKVGIELSARFGLRVSEITKLQYRDIRLDKGILHISDSKGGRSRDIYVRNEHRSFLEQLKGNKEGNTRIVPLTTDAVNKFLSRSLDKIGLKEKYSDAKTGIHSIRKMCAQEEFDKYRKVGYTMEESLVKVSNFLGHGDTREILMKEYIKDIY